MENPKISFLIAAHNEEKIISITLENLLRLPYDNYEVIIGLDGCKDRTEDIVKEFCRISDKFKYFVMNFRGGKPSVINHIMGKSSGEVIIINDADWVFNVKDRTSFKKLISVFNNPKIGGIAESFPIDWDEEKLKKGNLGYHILAKGSYFWLEYQKEKLTKKENNLLYIQTPTMFVTNIFRRDLYKENFSLGDDFERTYDIMEQGFKIVMFNQINMPRMIAICNKIFIKDLFKQKIRTAIARDQIKKKQNINFINYYFPANWYILKKGFRKGFSYGQIVSYWILINLAATLVSKFKNIGTREGWRLRARRV